MGRQEKDCVGGPMMNLSKVAIAAIAAAAVADAAADDDGADQVDMGALLRRIAFQSDPGNPPGCLVCLGRSADGGGSGGRNQ